jgi:hypothetical protein
MYPLIVDYNDGPQPVLRVRFSLTPEGHAICGGDIPTGATLNISSIDSDEILRADRELIAAIERDGMGSCALFNACIGRYFVLGYDSELEINTISGHDWHGMPYAMSYVGGEICPVVLRGGKTINRNHNQTFIACVF